MVHKPTRSPNKRRTLRTIAAVASATALAVVLAACSSGSSTATAGKYGFTEAKQTGGAITVWVDATRVAAANAFKKAYPGTPINVVTYDGSANGSNTFQTKIQLLDKAGSGWPDVVFSTQDNDSAWASQKDGNVQPFAAVLSKGLVLQSTQNGFATGSLSPCTVNGQLYCLRNDLANNVLWYNAPLMKQFGYAVPTTWEQYEALGKKVAAQHPGYIIGAAGDAWTPEIYMWASKCQANDVTGTSTITVNVNTTECKRMASLLDTLIANKSITLDSVFSPDFAKAYAGKTLMMPGPNWYNGAVFDSPTGLNVPAGQLAVAAPLQWSGDANPPVTGDVGGGTWFVSSHSKNLAAAQKFLNFVATSNAYQADLAPGLPAYKTAATAWVKKLEASNYYSGSLTPITTSASQVWTGWGSARFSQESVWSKSMTPNISAGKTITSLLPSWGTAIKDQAQVSGYTVK